MTGGGQRTRRSYGTGRLYLKAGNWYGSWWMGGRRVSRKLGAVRPASKREGLTRVQAERELRRRIEAERPAAHPARLTVEQAGERYVRHLGEVMQRKRTTTQDYEIMLRRHLAPFFGDRPVERVDVDHVAAYRHAKLRGGLSAKTVQNHLTFLHGLFAHALKRGWVISNPVAALDRPPQKGADPDIQFLDSGELEALLRATDDPRDRTLFLTAAMSGARQGELLALRWCDIDWTTGVIRIRRSYTRGQWGTPKSKRSTRAVPMADRLAGELERHFQRSRYQADDDLVFGHPQLGAVVDASKVRKRFKEARDAAGVRPIAFHGLRPTARLVPPAAVRALALSSSR